MTKQKKESQIKALQKRLENNPKNKYAIINKIKKIQQTLPSAWEEFLSR
jgi:hypothetical protein